MTVSLGIDDRRKVTSYESSQKVQYDIEYSGPNKLDGNVRQNTAKCLGKWADKGVGSLLFDNGALVVQCVDFGDTDESV